MADIGATAPQSSTVIGAGVVGLAAAVVLAEFGDVTLIERAPPRPPSASRWGFGARTVALHEASRDFLRSIDAWDALAAHPIRSMHVWEVDGTAAIDFRERSGLAWVAGNDVLERRLRDLAKTRSVRWVQPGQVVSIEAAPASDAASRWRVGYRNEAGDLNEICTDLVVGADGTASTVASLFKVVRKRVGRAQGAIATIAKSVEPHDDIAHQRFNRDGPVATLPLADPHLSSVIWSADRTRHEALCGLNDEAFAAALGDALEGSMTIAAVDRRFPFPLDPGYVSSTLPATGVVLLGDAARTLHPLAGQGLNLGIEDVVGLRRVLESGASAARWQRFADDRRARARFMLTFTSSLLETYRQQGPFARLVRNLGVRAVEDSPRLKAQLVREAMGLGPLAKVGMS